MDGGNGGQVDNMCGLDVEFCEEFRGGLEKGGTCSILRRDELSLLRRDT